MATFDYEPSRAPAERDVDATFSRAMARCDALEARSELVREHIVAARNMAQAAGMFDERPRFGPTVTTRRAVRIRRRVRLAVQAGLARTALRS